MIIHEYGRVEFVSEVRAKAIKEINKQRQTEEKKRCLIINRKIEDFKIARGLGITVSELNQGGVYQ